MIKLTAASYIQAYELRLLFSDGSTGVFDFAPFVQAATTMTRPLADLDFFRRFYIELGALAWPNGFDLSAGSLHQRLQDSGKLVRDSAA